MNQTSLRHKCSVNLTAVIINSILLIVVLLSQGSTLNYYLILHNEGTAGWYFLFLADFVIIAAFVTAGIKSYRFYEKKGKLLKTEQAEEVDDATQTSKVGLLPFSYIVWLCYAVLLVIKIVLLFTLDVARTLNWKNGFSPQLLKFVIALSAIVFLLLVVMHHDAKKNTQRHSYLTYLISGISFDIFDSVTFLGILFTTESRVVFTFSLENAILTLSCANLLLPGLVLYILSNTKFGLNLMPTGLSILYNILHLALINLPYFIIRVHLWTAVDHDVSIFLLKNILWILITARNITKDVHILWQSWKIAGHRFSPYTEQGIELGVICGQTEGTTMHMDEINLNEIKSMNKTHS